MTVIELKETLSKNIKKYRKGRFTQETLAEAIGVSAQNINDIEGKRRWPREETLVKLADILEIEIYELFIPEENLINKNNNALNIEKIKNQLNNDLVSKIRTSVNKVLDNFENK
ncbi:MAG: helix-turn-helix transcriptional regulator [Treponema sp.]|nr:helix-turn-helix transcriptional regulator [Treponema sp.]